MEKLKQVIKKKSKDYKTLSRLEQRIVELLMKYESLDFDSNFKVGPYYVDIAFPKHKVGLEIDGREFHSTELQLTKDELRQEYLEKIKGWRIERVPGWFCYRFPLVVTAKVLRHIPEVQNHPLFKEACLAAKQWYARDLINRGYTKQAAYLLGAR